MQLNIFWSLLLLSLFHYAEGSFIFRGWYNGDNPKATEGLGALSSESEVDDSGNVNLTAEEPERKMIVLKESIDPIHHNFIINPNPVRTSTSKISKYEDDSDPMEMMSREPDFRELLYNTVSQKMIHLSDMIDQMKKLNYGHSQYSESESEVEYLDQSDKEEDCKYYVASDEDTEEKEGEKVKKPEPEEKGEEEEYEDYNGDFEVVPVPDNLDMSLID